MVLVALRENLAGDFTDFVYANTDSCKTFACFSVPAISVHEYCGDIIYILTFFSCLQMLQK